MGKPIKLRPFQKKIIRDIYDNPHVTRQAIISFARKNAKTTLCAFLLLLHLVGPEAKPNSQLYSAAQSRDQAAVLFALAAKMVRMDPILAEFVHVKDSQKELVCAELGTVYKALSADADTAHGKSPIFAVHDELGRVRGPRSALYEAIESGMGAHDAPLSIVISTQAPTNADLLSLLIDRVAKGENPRRILSLWTAPEDMDPFSDEALKLANPAFGDFLNEVELRDYANEAAAMPSRENEYRNLALNQRVEMQAPFVSRAVWDACDGPVDADWGDAPVYGGLDLSVTTDLTALVLMAKVEGVWQVKPTFWLPEENLQVRAHEDRVPYDMFWKDGELEVTPGRAIEYEWVASRLVTVFETMNVQRINFDRSRMDHLVPWLKKAGLTEEQHERFEPYGQGFVSMAPALNTLEAMLLQQRIAHGGHRLLALNMANAVVKRDEAGNRKLDKKRSTGRIDGAVSLAMAAAASELYEDATERSIFDDQSFAEKLNAVYA